MGLKYYISKIMHLSAIKFSLLLLVYPFLITFMMILDELIIVAQAIYFILFIYSIYNILRTFELKAKKVLLHILAFMITIYSFMTYIALSVRVWGTYNIIPEALLFKLYKILGV